MTAQTDTPRRAVLITGATSGSGAATARRFIKEGWQVAINNAEASRHEAASGIAAAATAPGQRASKRGNSGRFRGESSSRAGSLRHRPRD